MYDLIVIGGGINGTGVARDAAGRGLKTLLLEKDDLASHTSSASTKLIHGGLRYLEAYDFLLVRKALIEREILLKAAPHIIWPMRFVLPHHAGLRPKWLLRLGLFLYDHLGGRELLPGTKTLNRKTSSKLDPLKPEFQEGFEYSDCWVEDARLVALNAVSASEHGADIWTRHACASLTRHSTHWTVGVRSETGETLSVEGRAVVNAAGPWVASLAKTALMGTETPDVRLVKGSHIIVPKLFDGDHSYFFQKEDGRIFFAIPYEDKRFTLIGTTDEPFDTPDQPAEISDAEKQYLCDGANAYFNTQITVDDIVATYSGVRPLYDDASANASKVTRDYVLSLNSDGGAPILSVFGGKITTYRTLAESVLETLSKAMDLTKARPWTADAALPGGDIEVTRYDAYVADACKRYPGLPESLVTRLVRAYGTRLDHILGDAATPEELGRCFGADLYEREVHYLCDVEFAQTAEDILWRRSKLGLHMTADEIEHFTTWFDQQRRHNQPPR